jgi:hypothetical protein
MILYHPLFNTLWSDGPEVELNWLFPIQYNPLFKFRNSNLIEISDKLIWLGLLN